MQTSSRAMHWSFLSLVYCSHRPRPGRGDSGLVSERQNVQATGYGCLLALGSRVTCRRHRRGHQFPPKTQQRGGRMMRSP